MRAFLAIYFSCSCILFAADPYWVSPTGAAAWASAQSATPLSGAACASTDTANINVSAGDTVIFRGGTYTLAGGNDHNNGVSPEASGTAENWITFRAHTGETPIIDGSQTYHYGINISSKAYIKIQGLTFRDVQTWASVQNGDNIEVVDCVFGPRTTEAAQAGFGIDNGSTNCWIHGNTFDSSLSPGGACAEGADLLRFGNAWSAGGIDTGNNYNTIESNVFAHAAHTGLENYGMYNVIRWNVFHNEPWITGCTTGQSGKETAYDTSSTSLAVGTGSKTLTVSTGKTYGAGSYLGIISTATPANAMNCTVTSYNSGTGELIVNVSYSVGSGTINAWTISKGNYPFYENSSYNGKYSHRNLQLTDDYGRDGNFTLVENNRLGHAGNNPGNGGPMNIDVASSRNIIRHNALYNGMSSGIYFKYASSDFAGGAILSSTSVEIGTGSKSWTIPSGLHLIDGQTVRVISTADKSECLTGSVTSYNESTGELVANITATSGSGTYNAWQIFWNGGSGGVNNKIYNNTIYHNGHGYNWRAYGNENVAYGGQGISQVNGAGTGYTSNYFKNNIIYDNKEGAIGSFDLYDGDSNPDQCTPEAWDFLGTNLTSNPSFANPDLTAPSSLTLPNLTLQAGSVAIESGGALTTVAVADTGSGTSLVVADASYFQDGTWGSALSDVQPDWIAVGTAGNTVQISSIDYSANTITLANAISRSDGDSVWLYKNSIGGIVLYGLAPDQGAYEFDPTSTNRSATISTLRAGTLRIGQ